MDKQTHSSRNVSNGARTPIFNTINRHEFKADVLEKDIPQYYLEQIKTSKSAEDVAFFMRGYCTLKNLKIDKRSLIDRATYLCKQYRISGKSLWQLRVFTGAGKVSLEDLLLDRSDRWKVGLKVIVAFDGNEAVLEYLVPNTILTCFKRAS